MHAPEALAEAAHVQNPLEGFEAHEGVGDAAEADLHVVELIEGARHTPNPGYRGVVFRRTSPQITAGGGLWDAAGAVYPAVGATANVSAREWRFPSGGRLAFRHLQHESNIYDWQGAELGFVGFDELTHFTERQFFYLLSRLRTTAGFRPYCRATTNPDAASWVARWVEWYVDPGTGYAIPEW